MADDSEKQKLVGTQGGMAEFHSAQGNVAIEMAKFNSQLGGDLEAKGATSVMPDKAEMISVITITNSKVEGEYSKTGGSEQRVIRAVHLSGKRVVKGQLKRSRNRKKEDKLHQ